MYVYIYIYITNIIVLTTSEQYIMLIIHFKIQRNMYADKSILTNVISSDH